MAKPTDNAHAPEEQAADEPPTTLPRVRRVLPALTPVERAAPDEAASEAQRRAPKGNLELIVKSMHRTASEDEPAAPPPKPRVQVALQPFRHRPKGRIQTMSDLSGRGGLQATLRERMELRRAQEQAQKKAQGDASDT